MWEPVGPLPAPVYWRRRGYALASVILFFIASGWSLAAVVAADRDPGASDEATTRAVNSAALTRSASTHPGPAAGSAFAAPGDAVPSNPVPSDPVPSDPVASGAVASGAIPTGAAPSEVAPSGTGPRGPGAAPTSAGPDGAGPTSATAGVEGGADPSGPTTTDETVRPDDTPRPPVAVPPASPAPSTGPPPCTNDMISVTAEIDRPEHRSGDHPVFRLVVTNVSGQACVRDLDGALQEIVVWSGDQQQRLWSSNDCVNPSTDDLRTLVPGQPVAFAVTWSGMTSTPGCEAARTRVPAGDYRLLTRVADRISPPTAFRLT
jgi:hypothetical protein